MTVNLGFRGEPSFHPDIVKFCEKTLAYPGFQLLLETSGLGWSDETAAALARLDRDRIDWIVTQDSIDPQTYASLRGEGFEEVFGFIEKLEPLFPRHVWPQAVRIQGGEEALEAFYRHWKERGGPLNHPEVRLVLRETAGPSGHRLKSPDPVPLLASNEGYTRPPGWEGTNLPGRPRPGRCGGQPPRRGSP